MRAAEDEVAVSREATEDTSEDDWSICRVTAVTTYEAHCVMMPTYYYYLRSAVVVELVCSNIITTTCKSLAEVSGAECYES